MKTLRFILGDQLSKDISSLQDCDKSNDIIFMCEVFDEATYVKHHQKKIVFLFSAMRHFAKELETANFNVDYVKLDASKSSQSFHDELARAVKRHNAKKVVVTFPGEYRVLKDMKTWAKTLNIEVEIRDDDRFFCTRDEFKQWAGDKKHIRMEFFYREMRKQHDVLMQDGKPMGGKWNYDAQNRKPPKSGLNIPATYSTPPDEITKEVITLVEKKFDQHFGDITPFHFAVTRRQALNALKQFIEERLEKFGDYQDAMIQDEAWMYHSHIGLYLNCGLLHPKEVVQAAEQAYRDKQAPLNAVEGFIRQILGWREFVRGIYWLHMPTYKNENFFNAKRKLPEFYWTGKTDMNCLKQCVTETKQHAYAHHIQRLMVLGNFALLAGIHPDEVNEWYLIVYADAYEWVELPNVSGMILFADGGYLASKPYAASGAYINKMSDYCKHCKYKVTVKNGEEACPFNYLYWDFLIRNESKLKNNQRLGMIYNTLKKMTPERIKEIKRDAERFLDDAT